MEPGALEFFDGSGGGDGNNVYVLPPFHTKEIFLKISKPTNYLIFWSSHRVGIWKKIGTELRAPHSS